MDVPLELRQLRYFVAVAEELHFGRAAARLHMSQSPLSRAIRELERELGVVLFIRTTRRVELTPAGTALLQRTRRALAEIDAAIADARGAGQTDGGGLALGYGPFAHTIAERIATAPGVADDRPVRLDEEVTPDALRRLAARELTAAIVMETPGTARHYRVRVDALRDEPLLAALAESHPYANATAIPVAAFAAERVLLPREPTGRLFNDWLRAVIRAAGFELERTVATMSAPWDRRLLPVASGDVVAAFVGEWVDPYARGVVAVPFDPPLTFPLDLASAWPLSPGAELLLAAALQARDDEVWLTRRPPRTELPDD